MRVDKRGELGGRQVRTFLRPAPETHGPQLYPGGQILVKCHNENF